jgi:hypothetical protein
LRHPRVLFIGLGETDDWAHDGSYPAYLNAAYLADEYLRRIWELAQSIPQYRGKTTLIVLPDHGRGEGANWTTHGAKIPESAQTWMAFLGPDTPPLGERKSGTVVTESQIAATLAALLGQDYHAAVPRSSPPISDVLGRWVPSSRSRSPVQSKLPCNPFVRLEEANAILRVRSSGRLSVNRPYVTPPAPLLEEHHRIR